MKVMLSLPEDAVKTLDLVVERLGTNRSDAVAALARNEYERIRNARRSDVLRLAEAADVHDGRGSENVAADRRR